MKQLQPGTVVAAAVLAAGLAVTFAPTAAWLLEGWRENQYYAHGPLALAAALVLVWMARDRLMREEPSAVGLTLVAVGAAMHVLSLQASDRPLSAAALLVVFAGLAWTFGGASALRASVLPLVLLALAIPLPQAARLAPWLAARVSYFAAGAANALGSDVVHSGPQLIVADGAMTVGAPCSGLSSMVALASLAVMLAALVDGPPFRKLLLVAAALPLALLANGLRLTALIWLADAFGTQRGLAFFHGPSSPLLFLLATVGLLLLGRAIGCDVPRPGLVRAA